MGGNFLGSPEQQQQQQQGGGGRDGSDWDSPAVVDSTSELRGIIPRTVEELFARLADEGGGSFDEEGPQAIVSCSYMEARGEKLDTPPPPPLHSPRQ